VEKKMMKTVSLFILVCVLCGSSAAETRIWQTVDGTVYEGSFEAIVFRKARIRDSAGDVHLVPIKELSPADLKYVSLNVAPKMSIRVRKKNRQRPFMDWSIDDDVTSLYTYTVRLTETSDFHSKAKLSAELFVIGEEVDGDNYVLMHRELSDFVFPEEKKSIYEFRTAEIPFRHYYAHWANQGDAGKNRGVTLLGYLVAVFDSKGTLIATDTNLGKMRFLSEDFPKSIEKLNELYTQGRGSSFARHFDATFRRRMVPRMPWHERTARY
jgi:hypothetical protein